MRASIHRMLLAGLLTASAGFSSMSAYQTVQAAEIVQPSSGSTDLNVSETASGVAIGLDARAMARGSSADAFASWPLVRVNGYMLPARTLTLKVDHSGPVNVVYDVLESEPMLASPARAEVRKLRGEDGEWMENSRDLAEQTAALPAAPVTILRDGAVNGTRWVVISVSPVFGISDEARQVTRLSFRIAGAQTTTVQQALATGTNITAAPLSRGAEQAALTCADTAVQPHEPLRSALADAALRPFIWRMTAAKVGLQQVTASAIPALPAGTALNRVQIWRDGVQLPAHVVDANANGVFDGTDEVRFFAALAGDRWNSTSGYWFSIGSEASAAANARMTIVSDAPPGGGGNPPPAGSKRINLPMVQVGAGTFNSAYEEGEWRELGTNRTVMYTNHDAGAGDYMFSRSWTAADGSAQIEEGIAARTVLPRAAGTGRYYVDGVRRNSTPAALEVRVGSVWSAKTTNTTFAPVWNATLFNNDTAETIAVRLSKAGGSGTALVPYFLQRVRWARPVALNFAGGKSAVVRTFAAGNYILSNAPAGTVAYDVTNPASPRILQIKNGAFTGTDGGRYAILLPGAATLTPAIAQYAGFADIVSSAAAAQALYVGPDWAAAKAGQLAAHRATTGYSAKVVNIQTIYDWFGNGDVSPNAIRNYFRHARAAWTVKPVAATLVGDGSNDPFNRIKLDFCTAGSTFGCTAGNDYVQPNIIPPYLADVDAYIGETACEGCYARLDCNDPLHDPLPDMYIGRLSVLNAGQLNTVVDKIIAYETADEAAGGGAWRNKAVYFADDTDEAGSFKDSNTTLMSGLPAMTKDRVEYKTGGNADATMNAMTAMMNAGAGLVHYNGHGASILWAGTPTLYTLGQAASVNSAGKNAFLIEMTCQTSQFHRSTDASAGSIDETFQRNANGPIAVFGPTGWDTIAAHELLISGMYETLRSVTGPANYKTAGELAMASYVYVFNLHNQSGEVDTLRTYMLLGDPLTKIRVKG